MPKSQLNLSSLDGTTGFKINGIDADDYSGHSVSSAGDVNGDGVDDVIIGAYWADPDGKTNAGQSYIVFGKLPNNTPTITSSAVTSINEDASYSYRFTASDVDVGDTVTLSAETKPDWLSFDAGTGVLNGTPKNDAVGDHSVTLRATDGSGAYAEQSFVVSVENITPEGQLWDEYRSRANLVDDELTVELLSDYSPTVDDPFGSAVSIPGNAILDLRNKSLSISDIPIAIPTVIPPMYVNVPEEIVDLADQKDVSIDIIYNDFVSEQKLILTVDGIVVEFTPDQVFYQPSPIAQPVSNGENLNINITITSDFIDELFANFANVIELGHENSALVRLTKLDNDNHLVTKAFTGDYSQTLSKQAFTDAEYNTLTYVGDEWTDSVVIGADDADTIKLSNQNTALYTGSGNDTIILDGNGTFGSGLAALNISSLLQTGTEERINLNGKTRFEDVVDGGADVDTVELTDASDALFLHDSFSGFHSSLTLSNDYAGKSGTARIENIETINAGEGDDVVDLTSPDYSLSGQNITVEGGEGNDTLWGSDANETLKGGNGDDELFGGVGVNELIGGSGADEFQFTKTSANDTIADFSISDGDTLKFFNTGGAQFDRDSIALNSAGDELTIAYGFGVDDALMISLTNAGLQLDDLTADVLFIV
ncbi:putative Ig domain-containing protein [bacterium]|nr:putative Ig domain-containing protein [bacterium]